MAPCERRIDDRMHLFQQQGGSIVLSVCDRNLDRIT